MQKIKTIYKLKKLEIMERDFRIIQVITPFGIWEDLIESEFKGQYYSYKDIMTGETIYEDVETRFLREPTELDFIEFGLPLEISMSNQELDLLTL